MCHVLNLALIGKERSYNSRILKALVSRDKDCFIISLADVFWEIFMAIFF
jgi:hypothetical protein